jgi:transcriptional regulator with XRE-family HTH domain
MAYEFEDAKELGATLAAARRAVGLTQEKLAERCGVSPSTLARHEAGLDAPSSLLLLRYCREVGLVEDEFFLVHREFRRARARLREGPDWFGRYQEQERSLGASSRGDLATRQVAAAAEDFFAALLRSSNRPD